MKLTACSIRFLPRLLEMFPKMHYAKYNNINVPDEIFGSSSLSRAPFCLFPRSSLFDFQMSFTILNISGHFQARMPCWQKGRLPVDKGIRSSSVPHCLPMSNTFKNLLSTGILRRQGCNHRRGKCLKRQEKHKHRTALSQPTEEASLSAQLLWCSLSVISKLRGEMDLSEFLSRECSETVPSHIHANFEPLPFPSPSLRFRVNCTWLIPAYSWNPKGTK